MKSKIKLKMLRFKSLKQRKIMKKEAKMVAKTVRKQSDNVLFI